jgi:hypothetical protein
VGDGVVEEDADEGATDPDTTGAVDAGAFDPGTLSPAGVLSEEAEKTMR